MKARLFLVQLILIFVLISCKKDVNDKIDDGITFRYYDMETNTTSTLVTYSEIIGYDFTKHAFVLDELAWGNFKKQIKKANLYVYPFPDFVIEITINKNLVYRMGYLPNFSATIRYDRMLFKLQEPNIVFIQPEPPVEMFRGEDLRNDPRLIKRLEKDHKLIELKN